MTDPAELTTFLRRWRYSIGNEAALQLSLADALTTAGATFEREVRLGPADRIDFMVEGGIGIEAKVRYPKRQIYRQLERYAAREQVTSLILVSCTALGLPRALNGKPIFIVSVGRSSL